MRANISSLGQLTVARNISQKWRSGPYMKVVRLECEGPRPEVMDSRVSMLFGISADLRTTVAVAITHDKVHSRLSF